MASRLHSCLMFNGSREGNASPARTRRFQGLYELRGVIARSGMGAQKRVVKMRTVMIAATVTLLMAAPLVAQENGAGGPDAKGYVSGLGGFATSVTNTTGDMALEGGVRIAPHLMVLGDIGRFANLQADLQPTIDGTTAALAANQGLFVIGGGSLPATYFTGGLRLEVPTRTRIMPYVLGELGVARLNPTPQFTFSSGVMPDGSIPDVGTDVTSALASSGSFTAPQASTSGMFTFGGGVDVSMATHWMLDVEYRYSRIAADTTLTASPLNTNGMTFGFGYRF
jgi:opacity protein-like surface antigen